MEHSKKEERKNSEEMLDQANLKNQYGKLQIRISMSFQLLHLSLFASASLFWAGSTLRMQLCGGRYPLHWHLQHLGVSNIIQASIPQVHTRMILCCHAEITMTHAWSQKLSLSTEGASTKLFLVFLTLKT